MKANELMIGDLVYNTFNQQAEQVVEIRQDQVILAYNDGNDYDEIEPIPLTPKILEKNGWMKVEEDGVFYPKQLKGELPWIGYATNGYGWIFRIRDFCEIKYVHQLQNALRICGIEKEITI